MGERLLCKQEVIGSIPFTSTTGEPPVRRCDRRSTAALKAGGAVRRWLIRRSEKQERSARGVVCARGGG